MRTSAALIVALLLLGGACTSGDPDSTSGDGSSATSTTLDPAEVSRAPGLTDDTIKVGVTYVDLEAIRDVVNTDHGDYRATYQARRG